MQVGGWDRALFNCGGFEPRPLSMASRMGSLWDSKYRVC